MSQLIAGGIGLSLGGASIAFLMNTSSSHAAERKLREIKQYTHYEENVESLQRVLAEDEFVSQEDVGHLKTRLVENKFDSLMKVINKDGSDIMRVLRTNEAAKALVGLPKDSLNVVFNRTIAAFTKVAR